MAVIKVYNKEGEDAGEMKVSDSVFGIKFNETLVHQVIVSYLANKRPVLAHTKTKGEVRGGGKKPWKQKGTGRARHGSTRSPIWVGGGVTFGPRKDRNFSMKINKKVKTKALAMILSDKLANDNLIVVDKVEAKNAKTKEVVSLIKNIFSKLGKKSKSKSILVTDIDKEIKLATRNLPNLNNVNVKDLNPLSAIDCEYMIIDKKALGDLEKRLK